MICVHQIKAFDHYLPIFSKPYSWLKVETDELDSVLVFNHVVLSISKKRQQGPRVTSSIPKLSTCKDRVPI